MKLNQMPSRKTLAVAGVAVFLSAIGGGAAYAAGSGSTVPATPVVYSQTVKVPAGTHGVPAGKITFEKTVELPAGSAAKPAAPVSGASGTSAK